MAIAGFRQILFWAGGTILASIAGLSVLYFPDVAGAQTPGCTLTRAAAGPDRRILNCGTGLRIEAEAGASYRLLDANGDGLTDGASSSSGALLIDYQGGTRRGGFQIRTPHAIAAVRGTTWAVDVSAGRTSVFVVQGRVGVARIGSAGGVVLGRGEGVDIAAGAGPLEVRRWPAPRAAALLARFGR